MESTLVHFNAALYGQMWGPSEFTATGSLKNYERSDVLPELNLPVLFTATAGRYDEATPQTVEYYQRLVPDLKLVIFEKSAHKTMLDEPDAYVEAIREFLREIDEKP